MENDFLPIKRMKITIEVSLNKFIRKFVKLYKEVYKDVILDLNKTYGPEEVEYHILYEAYGLKEDYKTSRHSIKDYYLGREGAEISLMFFQGKMDEIDNELFSIMLAVAANLNWLPKQLNGELYDIYKFK